MFTVLRAVFVVNQGCMGPKETNRLGFILYELLLAHIFLAIIARIEMTSTVEKTNYPELSLKVNYSLDVSDLTLLIATYPDPIYDCLL